MGFEVIGVVRSVAEAWEFAQHDMRRRERLLEQDGDPGLCPWVYKIHTSGQDGYRVTHEILATDL